MKLRRILLLAIAGSALPLVALGVAVAPGATASASLSTSPVFRIPAFTPVPQAQSVLVRVQDGVSFSLQTSELTTGQAGGPATFLVVIFNNPAGCSHGVQGLHCGEGDLVPGGPANPSVVPVTQRDPGADGQFSAGGHIPVNDPGDALFGPGLTNPSGADVHLVIRQNGALVQASVHEA